MLLDLRNLRKLEEHHLYKKEKLKENMEQPHK